MRDRPKLRLSTIRKLAPRIRSEEHLRLVLGKVKDARIRESVEAMIRAHSPTLRAPTVVTRRFGWRATFDLNGVSLYVRLEAPWFQATISYRYYEPALDRWRSGVGFVLRSGWEWARIKYWERKEA